MSYTAPTVNYSATLDGTYTTITGLQSVLINRGRQRFQDNFTPSICEVELIPANSYALPFAVGQFIDVRDTNSSSSPCYFCGVITDVDRKFSIPYNSVTGAAPADRITISATGATGSIAQNSVTNYVLGEFEANEAAGLTAQSVEVLASTGITSTVNASAINFTGGVFDLINALLRTQQNFIDDLDSKREFISTGVKHYCVIYQQGIGNFNFVFSDDGTLNSFKMSALDFLSSVQNTFTKIEVKPEIGTTQVASTGLAPFNTLVYDTYNRTDADALSLANQILQLQQFAAVTPYTVTTNTMISPTCTSISQLSNTDIFLLPFPDRAMNLGSAATVIFRNTSVLAQIQGISTIFYPDYAEVKLNLATSLGTAFTLNSSAFGILDTNRLAYP